MIRQYYHNQNVLAEHVSDVDNPDSLLHNGTDVLLLSDAAIFCRLLIKKV